MVYFWSLIESGYEAIIGRMCMKTLRYNHLLVAAALASLFSLAFALVSEYGFGLKPCELCIFQRIPYAVAIPLSLLGLWLARHGRVFCLLGGLLFVVDSGIGFYHTGVEKHWIKGPEACTDQGGSAPMSLEQILAKIQAAPIVACDQPQWEFHGITMAAMNAVWALMLAIAMFVAVHKIYQRQKHA